MAPIPPHCATLRSELDTLADLSTLVGKFLSDDKRKNAGMCCYEDKNFMLFGVLPVNRHHCRCCQHSICDNHTKYVKFIPKAGSKTYESYKIVDDKSESQCVKLCTECVNILDEFSKKNVKDDNAQVNSTAAPIVKVAEKEVVVDTPVTENVNSTIPVEADKVAEKEVVVDTPVTETVNTNDVPVEAEKVAEKEVVVDTPVTETVNTTEPVVAVDEEEVTSGAITEETTDTNVSTDTRNSDGAKKKRNKNKNKKN